MIFLNTEGKNSHQDIKDKYGRYMEYLSSNAHRFPKRTYEFAAAEWHYNPSDHRCPHDSWLEAMRICETSVRESEKIREIEMRISLLGAYHDGHLEITYHSVKGYKLDLLPDNGFPSKSHGDWLVDEVRLSATDSVIHEIKFWRDASWQIECGDIECNWLPFENVKGRSKH